MTYVDSRFPPLLLCCLLLVGCAVAADLDEHGLIVAEDMLIDEALTGALPTGDKKPDKEVADLEVAEEEPAEPEKEEVKEEAPEPLILETVPEAKDPEKTVGDLAVEGLTAQVEPEPVEKAEPSDGVREPDLEIEEILAVEEPVGAPAEEATAEERPKESVEDLAAEILGAEAPAEEKGLPVPEVKAEDRGLDAVVEEVLALEQPEPAAAEPAEEVVLEEKPPAVVEVAEEAEPGIKEPAAVVDEVLVVEEPTLEEPALEPAEAPAPAEAAEEVAEEPMTPEGLDDAVAGAVEQVAEVAVEKPAAAPVAEPVQEKPAAVPPTSAARAVAVQEPLSPDVRTMLDREALRRQAYEMHARDALKGAEEMLRARRYQEAARLFEEVRNVLDQVGPRPENARDRKSAERGLGESFYRWATDLKKQQDFDRAEQIAQRAYTWGHPKASKLIEMIRKEREGPAEEKPEEPERRWEQEQYKTKEKEIADALRKARDHFLVGEYKEAESMAEVVLSLDPHSTEAIRWMQKVTQKGYDVATMELEATRQAMMRDLRDTWNRRDYAKDVDTKRPEQTAAPRKKDGRESERVRILNKMKSIKIPEIDFRQANIHDVISFLTRASRDHDVAQEGDDTVGVNIILNLQAGGAPAAAPTTTDPFAEPLEGGGFESGMAGLRNITFNARGISLFEALRLVTQISNLKYRIEGSVVMIVPFNAPEGEILVRMYDVLPTVEEKISEVRAQLSTGRLRDTAGFGETLEAAPMEGQGADWKEALEQMGVKWPAGSSIRYVGAMGKIVVANTAANLTIFEQILEMLNVVPSQIEIEAKFVEVNQLDLDSLGFEWLLTDDWEIATKKNQGHLPVASRERLIAEEDSADGGFTKGNRFLSQGVFGATTAEAVSDGVLTFASVLTNPELSLIIHALQQKGSADLLSAPKVTTQSGAEATIKVVTEYIYPTDFEVTPVTAELEGGGSQIIGGVVEPSGFETREVGVLLTVRPEVSPEGQMINLTMTPEVVAEPEWHNYGTTYTDPNGNVQQLSMEQPFFHTRTISTSIAIYNEATVVMGGMITELRNAVDDKIPFLGDIPIIGRLFRSKYEVSEKRNLLIFVTARLVDPAGRSLKKSEQAGLTEKLLGEVVPE